MHMHMGARYDLTIENESGKATATWTMGITGLPGPPTGPLEISGVDRSQATLSWKPPAEDGGSRVTHYVVERRDTARDQFTLAASLCRVRLRPSSPPPLRPPPLLPSIPRFPSPLALPCTWRHECAFAAHPRLLQVPMGRCPVSGVTIICPFYPIRYVLLGSFHLFDHHTLRAGLLVLGANRFSNPSNIREACCTKSLLIEGADVHMPGALREPRVRVPRLCRQRQWTGTRPSRRWAHRRSHALRYAPCLSPR